MTVYTTCIESRFVYDKIYLAVQRRTGAGARDAHPRNPANAATRSPKATISATDGGVTVTLTLFRAAPPSAAAAAAAAAVASASTSARRHAVNLAKTSASDGRARTTSTNARDGIASAVASSSAHTTVYARGFPASAVSSPNTPPGDIVPIFTLAGAAGARGDGAFDRDPSVVFPPAYDSRDD